MTYKVYPTCCMSIQRQTYCFGCIVNIYELILKKILITVDIFVQRLNINVCARYLVIGPHAYTYICYLFIFYFFIFIHICMIFL